MDPTKKKLSGYAYKKKALQKKQKEEKLVKQTHKIDNFFNKNNDEEASSTGFNDLEEVTAQVSKLFSLIVHTYICR